MFYEPRSFALSQGGMADGPVSGAGVANNTMTGHRGNFEQRAAGFAESPISAAGMYQNQMMVPATGYSVGTVIAPAKAAENMRSEGTRDFVFPWEMMEDGPTQL